MSFCEEAEFSERSSWPTCSMDMTRNLAWISKMMAQPLGARFEHQPAVNIGQTCDSWHLSLQPLDLPFQQKAVHPMQEGWWLQGLCMGSVNGRRSSSTDTASPSSARSQTRPPALAACGPRLCTGHPQRLTGLSPCGWTSCTPIGHSLAKYIHAISRVSQPWPATATIMQPPGCKCDLLKSCSAADLPG